MNTSEKFAQKHKAQIKQIKSALEAAKTIAENYCPIYSNLIEYEMICGAIENADDILSSMELTEFFAGCKINPK